MFIIIDIHNLLNYIENKYQSDSEARTLPPNPLKLTLISILNQETFPLKAVHKTFKGNTLTITRYLFNFLISHIHIAYFKFITYTGIRELA